MFKTTLSEESHVFPACCSPALCHVSSFSPRSLILKQCCNVHPPWSPVWWAVTGSASCTAHICHLLQGFWAAWAVRSLLCFPLWAHRSQFVLKRNLCPWLSYPQDSSSLTHIRGWNITQSSQLSFLHAPFLHRFGRGFLPHLLNDYF